MKIAMGDRARSNAVESILDDVLPRVRRAAVARFGHEVGVEVAADARAWAWAHQDQLLAADNPAGLLYRVAQSSARPHHRWLTRRAPAELLPDAGMADLRAELVDLFRALGRLTPAQRTAVVLVHAHGEPYAEVAALLGVSTAAVTNHVHRGLRRLRSIMEEEG